MSKRSGAGHPLERVVAAVCQQNGAFVERNHEFATHGLGEFDVVATSYGGGVSRLLVEVTGGNPPGANDIYNLLGRKQILGCDRAAYLHVGVPDPQKEPLVREAARHGALLICAPDEASVPRVLAEALGLRMPEPELTARWVSNFEIVDALRQTIKGSAADGSEPTRLIKQRLHAIEYSLSMDPFERMKMLADFEDLGLDLTMKAAEVLGNQKLERRVRVFDALRNPEMLLVAGAAYVQHVGRVHYARAVVDAALATCSDPKALSVLDRPGLRRGHRHVRTAIEKLEVAFYLPAVLQGLLIGLGGFVYTPLLARELAFLAQHAGCDVDTVEAALELFPEIVEYHRGWWRQEGAMKLLKFCPAHVHGAGAIMRDHVHGAMWSLPDLHHWRTAARAARQALREPETTASKRSRGTTAKIEAAESEKAG